MAALSREAAFFARILVPGAAALALLALLIGRDRGIERDLHLIAPEQLSRGQALPVRVHLYANLRRPEGAELATAKVTVELRAGSRVLGRGLLHPSHARTLDGMLALPSDFKGRALLSAEAVHEDELARSERWLEVAEHASAAPGPHPRPLQPLQRLAAGPVQARAGAEGIPAALALRIEGGACVPERACTLLLHVGAPAASVRALPTPSVTPDAGSARPSAPTSAVVTLRVVTHGPEAELRIAVERDGKELATRAFRLAVALGASAMRELPRVIAAEAAPQIGLQEDEPGCIVDAFHEQRWTRTGSLRDCRASEPIPFAPLVPGLWRLQLRRDPFASSSAAVASVYMRRPGEGDDAVLARLATAARARDPDDALASALASAPAEDASEFASSARYLLALLDQGLLAPPEPVSGLPRALARVDATRARVRTLALCALVLCALTLGLLVAQRGLAAASEASRLMAEAGEEPQRLDRQRLRMTLRVLATVSSLLLAFAAIAAYVIARGQAP